MRSKSGKLDGPFCTHNLKPAHGSPWQVIVVVAAVVASLLSLLLFLPVLLSWVTHHIEWLD